MSVAPVCRLLGRSHTRSFTHLHTHPPIQYTLHIFCIFIAIEMISETAMTMKQHQRGDTMTVIVCSLDSDCKALEEIEFSLLLLSLIIIIAVAAVVGVVVVTTWFLYFHL